MIPALLLCQDFWNDLIRHAWENNAWNISTGHQFGIIIQLVRWEQLVLVELEDSWKPQLTKVLFLNSQTFLIHDFAYLATIKAHSWHFRSKVKWTVCFMDTWGRKCGVWTLKPSQERGEPSIWNEIHPGLSIMPPCSPAFLCSCPSFEVGSCWYNLQCIWDYKNITILGKVFQVLGGLLQNKPVLKNDLIQNVSSF